MFSSTQRAPSLGHFGGAAFGRERVIDARRCTVQLSTGRLYLDVAATSETALLGHDRPTAVAVDEAAVRKALTSLSPGYVCIGLCGSSEMAERLALRLGESAMRSARRTQVANALLGEPPSGSGGVIALENETLGRTGAWLASATWRRRPEFIVVGEALALGGPFGALLAKESVIESLRRGSRSKHAAPIRCTVQLSTGRLYLDVAATSETALLRKAARRISPVSPRQRPDGMPGSRHADDCWSLVQNRFRAAAFRIEDSAQIMRARRSHRRR